MYSLGNIVNLHNVKDLQKWLRNPDNIYIGRGRESKGLKQSKWHNPYKVSTDNLYDRITVVSLYEKHLRANETLLASLKELKGKTLGCWCVPQLCHATVLNRLLAEITSMDEAGIVHKLKRLSLQSPAKMDVPSRFLNLSEQEVSEIIAKTSSPTVLMPLPPLVRQSTTTTTSLVSTVSTRVSASELASEGEGSRFLFSPSSSPSSSSSPAPSSEMPRLV